jgi:hypothetical protein
MSLPCRSRAALASSFSFFTSTQDKPRVRATDDRMFCCSNGAPFFTFRDNAAYPCEDLLNTRLIEPNPLEAAKLSRINSPPPMPTGMSRYTIWAKPRSSANRLLYATDGTPAVRLCDQDIRAVGGSDLFGSIRAPVYSINRHRALLETHVDATTLCSMFSDIPPSTWRQCTYIISSFLRAGRLLTLVFLRLYNRADEHTAWLAEPGATIARVYLERFTLTVDADRKRYSVFLEATLASASGDESCLAALSFAFDMAPRV